MQTLDKITARARELKNKLNITKARKDALSQAAPATQGNIVMFTNEAGKEVIPVTRRNASGKMETVNMSMEEAAAFSRKTAGTTPKPAPAAIRPTASAKAAAPKPTPTPEKRSDDKDGYEVFPRSPKYRLTRAEFNELTPADKQRFLAAKGTLTD